MNIAIRFSGCRRADFPNADFEALFASSLERFRHRLKQVQIYLEDINGPRGGVDKQCRCVLHLHRMSPIVIQDRDDNVHTLLHRVAGRAAFVLSQKADRQVKKGRQNHRLQVR